MSQPFATIASGASRTVVLVGTKAFKRPKLGSYREGRLCNVYEASVWERERAPGLCPVLYCSEGGDLLIMPRVRIMLLSEFRREEDTIVERLHTPGSQADIEYKPDNLGWLDGRLVAIDYASATTLDPR